MRLHTRTIQRVCRVFSYSCSLLPPLEIVRGFLSSSLPRPLPPPSCLIAWAVIVVCLNPFISLFSCTGPRSSIIDTIPMNHRLARDERCRCTPTRRRMKTCLHPYLPRLSPALPLPLPFTHHRLASRQSVVDLVGDMVGLQADISSWSTISRAFLMWSLPPNCSRGQGRCRLQALD